MVAVPRYRLGCVTGRRLTVLVVAAAYCSASASPSTTAISAEVSTAIVMRGARVRRNRGSRPHRGRPVSAARDQEIDARRERFCAPLRFDLPHLPRDRVPYRGGDALSGGAGQLAGEPVRLIVLMVTVAMWSATLVASVVNPV